MYLSLLLHFVQMEDKIGCVVEGGGVVDGNGKSMKLDKKTRKKKGATGQTF